MDGIGESIRPRQHLHNLPYTEFLVIGSFNEVISYRQIQVQTIFCYVGNHCIFRPLLQRTIGPYPYTLDKIMATSATGRISVNLKDHIFELSSLLFMLPYR